MKLFNFICAFLIAVALVSCRAKKHTTESSSFQQNIESTSAVSMFQQADSIIITVEKYLPAFADITEEAVDTSDITHPPQNYIAKIKSQQSKNYTAPVVTHGLYPTSITAKLYNPRCSTEVNNSTSSEVNNTESTEEKTSDDDGSLKWTAVLILIGLTIIAIVDSIKKRHI